MSIHRSAGRHFPPLSMERMSSENEKTSEDAALIDAVKAQLESLGLQCPSVERRWADYNTIPADQRREIEDTLRGLHIGYVEDGNYQILDGLAMLAFATRRAAYGIYYGSSDDDSEETVAQRFAEQKVDVALLDQGLKNQRGTAVAKLLQKSSPDMIIIGASQWTEDFGPLGIENIGKPGNTDNLINIARKVRELLAKRTAAKS